MAYNVKQLEQLQDMIGTEAEVPNALDRYNAMQLLKRRPVRREDGGDLELHNNAEELASKGRYGDTMLMHVTPDEVRGLSSLRGGVTINPETGLPEAFPWLIPVLAGAAIGGVGSAVTGGDPLKGAAFGALGGAMGPAIGGLTAGTALGTAWGGLGAIGQGMLVGGAMGGVRSLFGESDNPMRDILMGAAMGGLGGAVTAPEGQNLLPDFSASATPEGMLVNPEVITNIPGQQFQPQVRPPSPIPQHIPDTGHQLVAYNPSATQNIVPNLSNPQGLNTVAPSTRSDHLTHFREDAGGMSDIPKVLPSAKPEYTGQIEARYDPTLPWLQPKTGLDKLSNWWDKQGDLEKLGIVGGGGMLFSGLMAPEPYAPLQEPEEVVEFEKIDPLPIRTPVPRTTEEILAQYLSSSPTAGQPQSWFTEQDVNVAKQGGLISLANGGGFSIPSLVSTPSFASSAPSAPQGSGPSGNFGVRVTDSGAIATQGLPGNLSQPRTGLSYSPLASSAHGRTANLANQNFSFDPGLVGKSFLSQLGHVVGQLPKLGVLGALVDHGLLGKNLQNFSQRSLTGEGPGVRSSAPSIQRDPSPIDTDVRTGQEVFPPKQDQKVEDTFIHGIDVANGGLVQLVKGGVPGPGLTTGAPIFDPYAALHPAYRQRLPQRRGGGDGGAPIPIEEEIIGKRFNVNPFDFDATLARIGGTAPVPAQIPNVSDQQFTLPPAASGALQGLLQRASDLPVAQGSLPEIGTAVIEEQGSSALDDLLQRAADLPQVQESADGGAVGLATGGNTPVFEGRVMGQGDGMDDDVAFGVVPQTPADVPNTPDMALLSSDEYVMPADVVSMLGNGSSTAGSKMLDQFNQLLRRKAHGTNKQQTQLDAGRELSSLV